MVLVRDGKPIYKFNIYVDVRMYIPQQIRRPNSLFVKIPNRQKQLTLVEYTDVVHLNLY